MSVSASSVPEIDSYEDIEHQIIHHTRGSIKTAEGANVDTHYYFDLTFDVPEIDRGEVLELVAGKFQVLLAPDAPHTPASEGHSWISFGTEDDPQIGPADFDWAPTVTDAPQESEDGSTYTVSGVLSSRLTSGTWYIANPHNIQPLEDQTNGVGTGPWTHMHHEEFNPREMFGRGPLVFKDDDLHEHWVFANNQNDIVTPYRAYDLYWAVHEQRDLDLF